jgi:peptidoglycan/xylan/chitin deacetylase (PgdA/CDA1 family)
MLWGNRTNLNRDPFNTFNWLMDQSEQAGIRSSFYFITEQTEPGIDGNYSLDDPEIGKLMRNIHERGHEIGLHPSYQTYLSGHRIKHQFDRLRHAAEAANIVQDNWGGRQHFLRWRAPDTWQFWEDAGLQYDSTLGYSDMPGFRCGVCYPYPVFNLLTRQPLKLIERPLIVMEQTLLHREYAGLNMERAFDAISRYRHQCTKYNGDFTMLWHNSYLVRSSHLTLYQTCIEQLM